MGVLDNVDKNKLAKTMVKVTTAALFGPIGAVISGNAVDFVGELFKDGSSIISSLLCNLALDDLKRIKKNNDIFVNHDIERMIVEALIYSVNDIQNNDELKTYISNLNQYIKNQIGNAENIIEAYESFQTQWYKMEEKTLTKKVQLDENLLDEMFSAVETNLYDIDVISDEERKQMLLKIVFYNRDDTNLVAIKNIFGNHISGLFQHYFLQLIKSDEDRYKKAQRALQYELGVNIKRNIIDMTKDISHLEGEIFKAIQDVYTLIDNRFNEFVDMQSKMNEKIVDLNDMTRCNHEETIQLLKDIREYHESNYNSDLSCKKLDEYIDDYFTHCYEKYNIMNTIVFGYETKYLNDLYVPLKLSNFNGNSEITIDDSCMKFFESNNDKGKLIIDSAGMGKSTLVKYMAITSIKTKKYIPIIIELRQVKNNKLIDFIRNQLSLIDSIISENDFRDLLSKGKFIIFFDGYDEVEIEDRSRILFEVKDFVQSAKKNKYVLTSREDNDLICLGGLFEYFIIKPFDIDDANTFINKYDNMGETSKKLFNLLGVKENFTKWNEFIKNPLLLSLLYYTYLNYEEDELPEKKNEFYQMVFETLFSSQDKIKGDSFERKRRSGMNEFEFENILTYISYYSMKRNKSGYTRIEIIKLIEKAISYYKYSRIAGEIILNDLLYSVPLFREEGDKFVWVHKSFMEYFAACFICKEGDEIQLDFKKLVFENDAKVDLFNVSWFIFEIDQYSFDRIILYEFLDYYINITYNQIPKSLESKYKTDLLDMLRILILLAKAYFVAIKYDFEYDFGTPEYYSTCSHVSDLIQPEQCDHIDLIYFSSNIAIGLRNKHSIKSVYKVILMKKVDIFRKININDNDYGKGVGQRREKVPWLESGVYCFSNDPNNLLYSDEYFVHLVFEYRDFYRIKINNVIDYKKCILMRDRLQSNIFD